MKRAILLIIITLACITGFLFVKGIFIPAPISDSGFFSVITTLFNGQYSAIYTLAFLLLLAGILYRRELGRIIHAFYRRVAETDRKSVV